MNEHYVLMLADGSKIVGSTRTELVSRLIEGYSDLPDSFEADVQALEQRHEFLVSLAARVQAELVSDSAERGEIDVESLTEAEATALFGDRGRIPDIAGGVWGLSLPLILIASFFKPYTNLTPPEGTVILLDPSTETSFLNALVNLGLAELLVRDET